MTKILEGNGWVQKEEIMEEFEEIFLDHPQKNNILSVLESFIKGLPSTARSSQGDIIVVNKTDLRKYLIRKFADSLLGAPPPQIKKKEDVSPTSSIRKRRVMRPIQDLRQAGWLTGKEFAEKHNLDYHVVVVLIKEHGLPAKRITGMAWLVNPEKAEEFLAANQDIVQRILLKKTDLPTVAGSGSGQGAGESGGKPGLRSKASDDKGEQGGQEEQEKGVPPPPPEQNLGGAPEVGLKDKPKEGGPTQPGAQKELVGGGDKQMKTPVKTPELGEDFAREPKKTDEKIRSGGTEVLEIQRGGNFNKATIKVRNGYCSIDDILSALRSVGAEISPHTVRKVWPLGEKKEVGDKECVFKEPLEVFLKTQGFTVNFSRTFGTPVFKKK